MALTYTAPSILNEPNFNFVDEVNEAVKSVDYSAFRGTSKEFAKQVLGFVPGYSFDALTNEQNRYLKALHNLLIAKS